MRDPSKIICIDTETTAKDPTKAEILQLSIIDYDGNVLFNHYIKPDHAKLWPSAERINHISPLKVANEHHLDYYHDELTKIFNQAELIVAYNGDQYDIPVISRHNLAFIKQKPSYDVMLEFARIYGAWDDYHKSYTWQKLATCANYYGYPNNHNFHDSLEDTRATLYCYKKMTDAASNESILNKTSTKSAKTTVRKPTNEKSTDTEEGTSITASPITWNFKNTGTGVYEMTFGHSKPSSQDIKDSAKIWGWIIVILLIILLIGVALG